MIGCPRTVTEQMSPNVFFFFGGMLESYIGPERRVRTPGLAPLSKGFPLLLSGHVEDISNERETFWPRGEGSGSPIMAKKTVQGEDSERGENEIRKVDKVERHRVNKTTGGRGGGTIMDFGRGAFL